MSVSYCMVTALLATQVPRHRAEREWRERLIAGVCGEMRRGGGRFRLEALDFFSFHLFISKGSTLSILQTFHYVT